MKLYYSLLNDNKIEYIPTLLLLLHSKLEEKTNNFDFLQIFIINISNKNKKILLPPQILEHINNYYLYNDFNYILSLFNNKVNNVWNIKNIDICNDILTLLNLNQINITINILKIFNYYDFFLCWENIKKIFIVKNEIKFGLVNMLFDAKVKIQYEEIKNDKLKKYILNNKPHILKFKNNKNLLHILCENPLSNLDLFKKYITEFDVNQEDDNDITPLMIIVQMYSYIGIPYAKRLIEHGAKITNSKNKLYYEHLINKEKIKINSIYVENPMKEWKNIIENMIK